MNTQKTPIAPKGFTSRARLVSVLPWGTFVRKGSAALCSDGKVRSLSYIAPSADTFFSVPASVKVNGKTVSGYVTTQEQTYQKGVKTDGPWLSCATFRQHTSENAPNGKLLPLWRSTLDEGETARQNALIASTFDLGVPSGEVGPFAIATI